MRRRQPLRSVGDPGGLLRFEYAEWADESEQPPDHWQAPDEFPSWRLIRARRRYAVAVRAWRAEHGVTWDEWQQMKRRGVTG